MSAPGWVTALVGVIAVVVNGAAVLVLVRRQFAPQEGSKALEAMSAPQRRRAMRQIRRGEVVAPEELAGVRAVAVQVSGQRALALTFAATAALFAAQALLPLFSTRLRVIDAVAAASLGISAAVLAHTTRRARRWLAAYTDPAGAAGVNR